MNKICLLENIIKARNDNIKELGEEKNPYKWNFETEKDKNNKIEQKADNSKNILLEKRRNISVKKEKK